MEKDRVFSIECFIKRYIIEFECQLPSIRREINNENIEEVIKAGWTSISKCSCWFLDNYLTRVNNVTFITPYYFIAFACRMLMETSSDVLYAMEHQDEIEKFFKERKDIIEAPEEIYKKIGDKSYNKQYALSNGTIGRIEKYYNQNGVKHYKSLCWSTHFNYVGCDIESKNNQTTKLRYRNLAFIIEALNKFLDAISLVYKDNKGLDKLMAMYKDSMNVEQEIGRVIGLKEEA